MAGTWTTLREASAFRHWRVFTPDAPLTLGQTYDVVYCPSGSSDCVTAWSFTVNTDADAVAPGALTIADEGSRCEWVRIDEDEPCPVSLHLSNGISFETSGLLQVVRWSGEAGLDVARVDGEVRAVALGHVSLGRPRECGTAFGWPEIELGATAEVEVGAFDLAGNFSGWSSPEPIVVDCTAPEDPCQDVAGSSGEVAGTESDDTTDDDSGSFVDESGDATGRIPPSASDDESGCACRSASPGDRRGSAWLAWFGVALGLGSRRR